MKAGLCRMLRITAQEPPDTHDAGEITAAGSSRTCAGHHRPGQRVLARPLQADGGAQHFRFRETCGGNDSHHLRPVGSKRAGSEAAPARPPPLKELQGQLLGQCASGELLRHEGRTRRGVPEQLPDPRRSPRRRVPYVEGFYNQPHQHSGIGHLAPEKAAAFQSAASAASQYP